MTEWLRNVPDDRPRVGARIPHKQMDVLTRYCERHRMTRVEFIRKAIWYYLRKHAGYTGDLDE